MADIDVVSLAATSSAHVTTRTGSAPSNLSPARQRLWKATHELEGWFVGTLMKQMHASATKGGIFGQGSEAGMYREMFDEAVGKQIGETGSFGLADTLYRQLVTGIDEDKK
jgi:Rod binding domain-containing protein